MHRVRGDVRNVAIIAHVDHGKTTLVDGLLKQSRVFRQNQQVGTLIMDTNELERERGITILAKNAAVTYRNVKINIIDTPGHADFGGEVERVLGMADGCLLLVDAVEGPMPQTRFVLRKAFELGLRPLLVINKIDRPNARPREVLSATQDLFLELAQHEDQLEFPVIYTVARDGLASLDPDAPGGDLQPLFTAILDHVPPPYADPDAPLQLLVTTLDHDDHRGKIAVGRVVQGTVNSGQPVAIVDRAGHARRGKVAQVWVHHGLGRREVEMAEAGEIIALSGLADVTIGETVACPARPERLPAAAIDEPTLKMTFGVNTSPLAGREGRFCTSRQLRSRLSRELETNLSLRVQETDSADVFLVSGRGELHLAILIETMRREGYEFQVSRPDVITKVVDGQLLEPWEQLMIDTTEDFIGPVSELVGGRLGRMVDMKHDGAGGVRLEYAIPTRGLIGLRNVLLTATRGNGAMSSLLLGYQPWSGPLSVARNGALVASQSGVAMTHGLANAQERGQTFVEPGAAIYEGMIVGLYTREGDIEVNVCKEKKKTNIRSSTEEIGERLTPPLVLSLEQSLDFLRDDELLEVSPRGLRLRKKLLTQSERAKARKQTGSQQKA